jgi:hypothetical protein
MGKAGGVRLSRGGGLHESLTSDCLTRLLGELVGEVDEEAAIAFTLVGREGQDARQVVPVFGCGVVGCGEAEVMGIMSMVLCGCDGLHDSVMVVGTSEWGERGLLYVGRAVIHPSACTTKANQTRRCAHTLRPSISPC